MSQGHSSKKEYLVIFAVLAFLTVVEVVVADERLGIPKTAVGISLVLLAVAKAGLVAYFYMHLKSETKAFQYTMLLPFFFPVLYAFVLIAEASWRLSR